MPFRHTAANANVENEYKRSIISSLCQDSKELPGLDALRERMIRVCMEQNVTGGIMDDVPDVMIYALEVLSFV